MEGKATIREVGVGGGNWEEKREEKLQLICKTNEKCYLNKGKTEITFPITSDFLQDIKLIETFLTFYH